jgi:signal transduction histidine kinase
LLKTGFLMRFGSLLLGKLDQLVDWFIPDDMAACAESTKQARIFLLSHLCGPFIGNVVPAALYIFDPVRDYRVGVLAASITGFWVFPFVLRAFGRYNLLAILSVQNLIFCILWSCYFYGGVSSPTLPWVLTIPLLAFFYLGQAPGLRLVVLGLFTANVAAFCALYLVGHNPVVTMPRTSLQGLGIVSTAAAALYVAMMALYYAKILASGVELETEMRRHLATADELRLATAEAERAGAAKAEFLAKMSHELRTPLNAVIGYSQILLEDAAEEGDTAAAADLERIHGAGHHLLRLVNDVLDLSKIEAGKMDLSIEQIRVVDLLTSAVEGYEGAARAAGNELVRDFDESLGTINCDPIRLQQAVSQIVDNATKFTKNGRITVSAYRTTTAGADELIVEVRDTGIGIATENIPDLFENFTVAADASESKYGGTGLGLALSGRICKLLGGDITVTSQLGVGSCFRMSFPCQQARSGGEPLSDSEAADTRPRAVDAPLQAVAA